MKDMSTGRTWQKTKKDAKDAVREDARGRDSLRSTLGASQGGVVTSGRQVERKPGAE